MTQRIAFFDFDGTITTRDTLIEMIRYEKGSFRLYCGFLLHLPVLLAYKTGIISNSKAKEKILRFFWGKMPVEKFQKRCDEFATMQLPALIRPNAVSEIEKHIALGTQVVIVSASAQNWFVKWTNTYNLPVISTNLEVQNNRVTGRIEGKNCHGNEKVNRIKQQFDLSAYDEIYAYGDSRGDIPMLNIATIKFYKPFR